MYTKGNPPIPRPRRLQPQKEPEILQNSSEFQKAIHEQAQADYKGVQLRCPPVGGTLLPSGWAEEGHQGFQEEEE